MYELCLEYGTFPISLISAEVGEAETIPDFLENAPDLVAKLNELNDLFHSLFIEIEGNLDFIGRDKPEAVASLQTLYDEVAKTVAATYQQVRIEPLYLR